MEHNHYFGLEQILIEIIDKHNQIKHYIFEIKKNMVLIVMNQMNIFQHEFFQHNISNPKVQDLLILQEEYYF